MDDKAPPRGALRQVRILLWVLVALAIIGTAVLLLMRSAPTPRPQVQAAQASFGGPFTLVGADGKPFSSATLAGKPYAIFFGFTRCGDVCPTTLSRLVKLRRDAASYDAMNLVFVTIDPENDGPKEVGQYAGLFDAPIIGLTGTKAQIAQVKKQYGIYAEPTPHAGMGHQVEHTGTVLLFDRGGEFAGTISPGETNADALTKLKKLTA
jgi:protein SCO1/2